MKTKEVRKKRIGFKELEQVVVVSVIKSGKLKRKKERKGR
jgi:hypothetical protein